VVRAALTLFQLGSLAQEREIDRRAAKEDFPETRFLNVQFPSPRPLWSVGFLAEHSNANNHCKGADSGESDYTATAGRVNRSVQMKSGTVEA
jgi:hypothetical protein